MMSGLVVSSGLLNNLAVPNFVPTRLWTLLILWGKVRVITTFCGDEIPLLITVVMVILLWTAFRTSSDDSLLEVISTISLSVSPVSALWHICNNFPHPPAAQLVSVWSNNLQYIFIKFGLLCEVGVKNVNDYTCLKHLTTGLNHL